ncbi:MAG TPA: UsfY protein [Mycobacterium sp.]|nr:UsfY protein [Mycobacterium sp.]
MPDRLDDPTDHARTAVPRAGEAMKDNRGLPGYVLIAVAVVAVVICIVAAAVGAIGWAVGAGIVAVLAAAAGSVWVYAERRRVGRVARANAPRE